jgi:hypothetical protein
MYVNKGVKPENPGLFMRPEVCPGCPFDKETFEHIWDIFKEYSKNMSNMFDV